MFSSRFISFAPIPVSVLLNDRREIDNMSVTMSNYCFQLNGIASVIHFETNANERGDRKNDKPEIHYYYLEELDIFIRLCNKMHLNRGAK